MCGSMCKVRNARHGVEVVGGKSWRSPHKQGSRGFVGPLWESQADAVAVRIEEAVVNAVNVDLGLKDAIRRVARV